jgi:hypothetical protein
MTEALKLDDSPRESVSRSNEVRIVAPAGERWLAGGETGSGEQPAVSDNAVSTPNTVGQDERIQASGENGAKARG